MIIIHVARIRLIVNCYSTLQYSVLLQTLFCNKTINSNFFIILQGDDNVKLFSIKNYGPLESIFRCEMSSIRNFRVVGNSRMQFKIDGRDSWVDSRDIVHDTEIQRFFERFLSSKEIFKFQIEFGENLSDCLYKVHTQG